jgi:hypothetical protein
MPLYHFHLWTGEDDIPDIEGTILPSDDAARAYAERVARELIKSKEVQRRIWRLHVADEKGATLFQLPFGAIDESLDHLDPGTRELVERSSASRSAAARTILDSKFLIMRIEALNRRAVGMPYVAARGGRRVL